MGSYETSAGHERIGEVLVVRLVGVLTLQSLAAARQLVRGLLAERDARAVIMSLENAVPLFGSQGWDRMADDPISEQIPMAIVVAPMHELAIRAYCLEMANRGYVRGPFIGEAAAIVWASQCREHWPARPSFLPVPPPPPRWQSPRPERSGHTRVA